MKNELAYVLSLRVIAAPCRVDYHPEFHARPSVAGSDHTLHCLRCTLIEALILSNFEWKGDENGYWGLKVVDKLTLVV